VPNYNQVVLVGHVTRDPEIKYTPSGTAIADIGVAVNEHMKDKEDLVSFIDCTAFGKTAELCVQYVHKGDPILVAGRLRQERWETQEGQKRSKVKVMAHAVQFLRRRQDQGQETETRTHAPESRSKPPPNTDRPEDDTDQFPF